MSSSDGLVLSDVHLCKIKADNEKSTSLQDTAIYRTDFHVTCSAELLHKLRERLDTQTAEGCIENDTALDDDGDIILPRETPRDYLDLNNGSLVLRIYHSMETQLRDVGLQVWAGALLMVDFILHNPELFANKHVMELGCGAGLPSIIAGTIARSVTSTDTGESVLRLSEMNYQANSELICCPEESFIVRELNWFDTDGSDMDYRFDCIIACDVVYDNDITDAFFRTVYRILGNTKPVPTLYISLEKRLNFTVTELDVTCKEYDHFRSCLGQLEELCSSVKIHKIDTDALPQHCDYHRTAQLEMWTIYSETTL